MWCRMLGQADGPGVQDAAQGGCRGIGQAVSRWGGDDEKGGAGVAQREIQGGDEDIYQGTSSGSCCEEEVDTGANKLASSIMQSLSDTSCACETWLVATEKYLHADDSSRVQQRPSAAGSGSGDIEIAMLEATKFISTKVS